MLTAKEQADIKKKVRWLLSEQRRDLLNKCLTDYQRDRRLMKRRKEWADYLKEVG